MKLKVVFTLLISLAFMSVSLAQDCKYGYYDKGEIVRADLDGDGKKDERAREVFCKDQNGKKMKKPILLPYSQAISAEAEDAVEVKVEQPVSRSTDSKGDRNPSNGIVPAKEVKTPKPFEVTDGGGDRPLKDDKDGGGHRRGKPRKDRIQKIKDNRKYKVDVVINDNRTFSIKGKPGVKKIPVECLSTCEQVSMTCQTCCANSVIGIEGYVSGHYNYSGQCSPGDKRCCRRLPSRRERKECLFIARNKGAYRAADGMMYKATGIRTSSNVVLTSQGGVDSTGTMRCVGSTVDCIGKRQYGLIVNRRIQNSDCDGDCGRKSGTSLVYNEKTNWAGIIGGIMGPAGQVISTLIGSNAYRDVNAGWQDVARYGIDQCHGVYGSAYQGYLDYLAGDQGAYQDYLSYLNTQQTNYQNHIRNNELPDTGANFVDPGAPAARTATAPTRINCNGYGMGSFAGYGGFSGNGFGSFGNPFLGAGYSQGFLGFMNGPYNTGFNNGMGLGGGVQIGITSGGFGGYPGGFSGGSFGGGMTGGYYPGYNRGLYPSGGSFGGTFGGYSGGVYPTYPAPGSWNRGGGYFQGGAGLGLNNPWSHGGGSYWNSAGGWAQWQNIQQTNAQAFNQDSMFSQQALANQAQAANQNLWRGMQGGGYYGSYGSAPFSMGNLGFSLRAGYGVNQGPQYNNYGWNYRYR